MRKKGTEGSEEPKEPDLNLLASYSSYRRSRSIGNINDPWKEVSEEGVEHICASIDFDQSVF